MRDSKKKRPDIEICRDKIKELLREYNCEIRSCEEWYPVYIEDLDTQQSLVGINP